MTLNPARFIKTSSHAIKTMKNPKHKADFDKICIGIFIIFLFLYYVQPLIIMHDLLTLEL